ncbi:MAG: AAA family ATPase [Oxalobacter formigenes]|nr:AAA family ATPase [Oxalobacter formigenes]
MYIHSLELTQFRGARKLSITLDKKLNVFVGMNGSGKSSILDASAIMLSWLANRIRTVNASGRPVSELDITNETLWANLKITLGTKWDNFSWHTVKYRLGYSRKDMLISNLMQASKCAELIQKTITESEGNANIPLFIYYPVNRSVLDVPLRIRNKHRFTLLSAYDDALTSAANFRTFFEWFRDREDLENEEWKHFSLLHDVNEPSDRQLNAVRCALKCMMPEFTDLTVRRNPLRMEVKKDGMVLKVNQLSDGEKCLMAMVGDLARRMAIANPARNNPLEGEGVVLIDEIDLHLHPLWQRKIIPGLQKTFPNCQFIVSTHSPHVITHVRPECLFLLELSPEGLTCCKPEESYGKTSERILEDLMGLKTTRPEEIKAEFDTLFDLIQEGRIEEAKEKVQSLKTEIGADPELSRAKTLITRKELIGK